jgi:hypothetical protein
MFLWQVLPSNDGKEPGKILFNEQKWPSNGVPHVSVMPLHYDNLEFKSLFLCWAFFDAKIYLPHIALLGLQVENVKNQCIGVVIG